MTGVKIEPFVTTRNNDGTVGYYSVIYVKADSPYKDIEDLKGKTLGLVDPNSTSGNNVPRFFLNKARYRCRRLLRQVDHHRQPRERRDRARTRAPSIAPPTGGTPTTDSNLTRMVAKGMAKKEDFRIIFKSELLAGSPYAYLSDLPADLKQAIVKAFIDAPTKDKAAFDQLSDGKDKEFVPVTHKDYENTVDMIQFVNDMRKKRS